jgi:hypothetical protein
MVRLNIGDREHSGGCSPDKKAIEEPLVGNGLDTEGVNAEGCGLANWDGLRLRPGQNSGRLVRWQSTFGKLCIIEDRRARRKGRGVRAREKFHLDTC